MTSEITTYLKYANLQIAAEAFIVSKRATPEEKFSGNLSYETLLAGNDHSSRFTEDEAKQFANDWTVVEHISNTSTGFSGTLFRALRSDPARGIEAGELVLSFRSTEFIDDSARDNQATNALEIKEKGWAFGQIADMEAWYKSLVDSGDIPAGKGVTVTGYSLGGHLATAFNLLRQQDPTTETRTEPIKATYTFNGAGVGEVKLDQTLSEVIRTFDLQRKNISKNEIVFSEPDAQAMYEGLRSLYGAESTITAQGARDAAARVKAMRTTVGSGEGAFPIYLPTERNRQLGMLQSALERIAIIQEESLRVIGLKEKPDKNESPLDILGPKNIEALRLDYQLAVLAAAEKTNPSAGVIGGGWQALFGREQGPFTIPNFYDIYGDTMPSAVSNSQLHYGTVTPVFIEDQPLLRGSVRGDALAASAQYHDVKLLVDHYGDNDFGDTHSPKLARAAAEINRRQAEIATVREMVTKLETTLPIAKQREADFHQLANQGFMSSHANQDRTRERIELERDLAMQRARLAEANATLRESENTRFSYIAETKHSLRTREAAAELKRQQGTQDLAKAGQRERLTTLKAPVAGTVQQLVTHTEGGVVTEAQPLMVIVPQDAQVTAEVTLENKDIGFVSPTQEAAIKLETFPYTRYGTVKATVKTVTADAVNDEKRGAIFPVMLNLNSITIDVDGKAIKLSPGMNLTAEIKTGKRRIIEFLLSPVQRVTSESLRER